MKKFWIGLLTGSLAVPAIFFGTTAIVAKNNDRTLREQLQQIVAEKVVDTEDETLEDDELVDLIPDNEEIGQEQPEVTFPEE